VVQRVAGRGRPLEDVGQRNPGFAAKEAGDVLEARMELGGGGTTRGKWPAQCEGEHDVGDLPLPLLPTPPRGDWFEVCGHGIPALPALSALPEVPPLFRGDGVGPPAALERG